MVEMIQATLTQKGFTNFYRPFELNIVGIRADSVTPNSFAITRFIIYI